MDDVKEKKPSYSQKVAWDMSNLYLDTSSVLHCDFCHERFGVLHMLRYALFKKKGSTYYVFCKSCHQNSPRVKGAYKEQTEEMWENFQNQNHE